MTWQSSYLQMRFVVRMYSESWQFTGLGYLPLEGVSPKPSHLLKGRNITNSSSDLHFFRTLNPPQCFIVTLTFPLTGNNELFRNKIANLEVQHSICPKAEIQRSKNIQNPMVIRGHFRFKAFLHPKNKVCFEVDSHHIFLYNPEELYAALKEFKSDCFPVTFSAQKHKSCSTQAQPLSTAKGGHRQECPHVTGISLQPAFWPTLPRSQKSRQETKHPAAGGLYQGPANTSFRHQWTNILDCVGQGEKPRVIVYRSSS